MTAINSQPAPSASGVVHMRQDEFQRMKDEMKLIRRKFKYIQGVSTVFRQKIAFILRDLATSSSRLEYTTVGDMAKAYANALKEVGQLGTELSASVLGRDEDILGEGNTPTALANMDVNTSVSRTVRGGGGGDALSFRELLDRMEHLQGTVGGPDSGSTVASTHARAADWIKNERSRDDIRKAHHLCVILDEKNKAKAAATETRDRLSHLQSQYSTLNERYQRLVQLLQKRGGGGGVGGGESAPAANSVMAAVERELYEQRIASLEDELMAARTQLNLASNKAVRTTVGDGRNNAAVSQYATGGGGDLTDPSTAAGGLLSLTNTSDVKVLQKQNAILRARVQSLRQEVSSLRESGGAGAVEELQKGMDGLFERLRSLQHELAESHSTIQRLTAERADQRAAVDDARRNTAAYIDQLSNVNAEYQSLAAVYNELRSAATSETHELAGVVAEYSGMVAQRDGIIKALQSELDEERRASRAKEANVSVLGAQIESLRSRIDVMVANEESMRLQSASLEEMRDRMHEALSDMQALYANGSIAGQIESLAGKMAGLEGLEMQSRIKDDQIASLQDEVDRIRASHHELTISLNSVTSLFASMPKSSSDLEALVVELEECRAELSRCISEQCPPDASRLTQNIELRVLEARHAKKSARIESGKASRQVGAGTTVGGGFTHSRGGISQGSDQSGQTTTYQRNRAPFPPAQLAPDSMRYIMSESNDSRSGVHRARGVLDEAEDEDAEMAAIDAALLAIPPPPTLVRITDSLVSPRGLQRRANETKSYVTAKDDGESRAVRPAPQGWSPSRSDTTGIGLYSDPKAKPNKGTSGDLREARAQRGQLDDIHMTFDLFAEPNDGGSMVMTHDGLSMAFSTLGIELNLLRTSPPPPTHMDRDSFTTYCLSLVR